MGTTFATLWRRVAFWFSRGVRASAAIALAATTCLGLLAMPGDAFAACAPAPPGAISWYRAEGNANDSQGTNQGTNFAAFAAGRVGQAFSLNGSSSYISVPDHATLRAASVTIEAWVNFSSVPGLAMIASKAVGGGTWNSHQIYLMSGLHMNIGNAGKVRFTDVAMIVDCVAEGVGNAVEFRRKDVYFTTCENCMPPPFD